MQSYNHTIQGSLSQDYWMFTKHVPRKTLANHVFFVFLAISALLHPLAALTATFSAVAFCCYIK